MEGPEEKDRRAAVDFCQHFLAFDAGLPAMLLANAAEGGWAEVLRPYLEHSIYFGVMGILIVCGIGLPIPEELTFLVAGYVAAKIDANVWLLCACGLVGIMVGDSIPYWLGRKYGMGLLQHRWISKVITPKMLERTQEFFRKRGSKTVFAARFVAGLRMPTFFLSGAMGVKYWTFFFWDFLGALISCPTSIWLAWRFGPVAEEWLHQSKIYVAGAVGILVLYGVYHYYSHKKPPEAGPPGTVDATASAPPASAPEGEGAEKLAAANANAVEMPK